MIIISSYLYIIGSILYLPISLAAFFVTLIKKPMGKTLLLVITGLNIGAISVLTLFAMGSEIFDLYEGVLNAKLFLIYMLDLIGFLVNLILCAVLKDKREKQKNKELNVPEQI